MKLYSYTCKIMYEDCPQIYITVLYLRFVICIFTITNMATVRNFDVTSVKLSTDKTVKWKYTRKSIINFRAVISNL
jgi:hypothetical protein